MNCSACGKLNLRYAVPLHRGDNEDTHLVLFCGPCFHEWLEKEIAEKEANQ